MTFDYVIADLNGDSKPDLVFLDANNAVDIVLDATGTTPQLSSIPLNCTVNFSSSPVVGDVNDDGKPDIAISCASYVVVFVGKGDGTFQTPAYYAINTMFNPVLVDLNGDKYPDLVVVSKVSSGPQKAVFLNEGSAAPGTFASAIGYPTGSIS